MPWPKYSITPFSKQDRHSDDFGLRNPVIQKILERKCATSIVEGIIHTNEWEQFKSESANLGDVFLFSRCFAGVNNAHFFRTECVKRNEAKYDTRYVASSCFCVRPIYRISAAKKTDVLNKYRQTPPIHNLGVQSRIGYYDWQAHLIVSSRLYSSPSF